MKRMTRQHRPAPLALLILLLLLPLPAVAVDLLASSPVAAAYRTKAIDASVTNLPSRIEQAVLTAPSEATLRTLVETLVASTGDSYARVKRIHDWIALHISYDNDAFLWGEAGSQDPFVLLKNRRTTCGGFARLFKTMADMAGIETRTVTGLSRGYVSASSGTPSGHAWNAVRIDGLWHIIDVTADNRSGFENDEFKDQSGYRDGGLFLHPLAKRIANLANKPEEQFALPVMTRDEFLAAPLVYDSILRFGIALAPESANRIVKVRTPVRGGRYLTISDSLRPTGDRWQLDFSVPANVDIDIVLEDEAKMKHPFHALTEREGGLVRCTVRPPVAGNYTAIVRASFNDGVPATAWIYKFSLQAKTGGAMLGPAVRLLPAGSRLGLAAGVLRPPSARDALRLEVRHPASHDIYCYLFGKDGKQIPGMLTTSHLPDRKRFYLRVPENGDYSLGVWARNLAVPGQAQIAVMQVPLFNMKKSAGDALPPAGEWIANWRPLTNGFRLRDPGTFVADASGAYTVECAAPNGSAVTASLVDASGKTLPGCAAEEPVAGGWKCTFIPPAAGRYTARIHQLTEAGTLVAIATARIDASADARRNTPRILPTCHFARNGVRLLAQDLAATDGYYTFELGHAPAVIVGATLRTESGTIVNGAVSINCGRERTRIDIALPKNGTYVIDVHVRSSAEKPAQTVLRCRLASARASGRAIPPRGLFIANRLFVDRGFVLKTAAFEKSDAGQYNIRFEVPDGSETVFYLLDAAGKVVKNGVTVTQNGREFHALFDPQNRSGARGRVYLNENGKKVMLGEVRLRD